MEGHRKIFLLLLTVVALSNATTTTKDVRTAGLPEKIIGGVIDLVQSHKNKPTNQQTVQPAYPNTPGYQPQYPQYQQWNGQNYQGQGFNYQGQYQNQGQYAGQYPAPSYPTNSNYGTGQGQVYPTPPVGGFNNGQTQSQGQYQIVYQNPPSSQGQYTPTTGQYQNNQQNQFQGQNQQTSSFQNQQGFQGQNAGSFQGQNTGSSQGQNTGSFQGQNTGSFQGQNGSFQAQGVNQGTDSSGQHGQGFQVSQGGHQGSSNGGGPTCVCQAWTKPSETLNDPAAEKTEKSSNEPVN